MIKSLTISDIPQVAKIHHRELPGFLSELGIVFLEHFYKESLYIPEIFTLVEKKNDQILGLVSGITTVKGLYKKIIFRDLPGFGILFLSYIITHPIQIVKMVKILMYPGFMEDIPELLIIAVSKGHQKKGIGKKLFHEITRQFRKRGIKKFKISVYERMPANGFYKKIGCRYDSSFDFLGEKMNYYTYQITDNR